MISMSTNKIDFKETCETHSIPVPKTYLIGNEIPSTIIEKIKYPVFVKPIDSSGSRGAGVCLNKDQLDKQFVEALSFSPSQRVMVEEYIIGTEFLLDYVGVGGEFRLLSMFDRYMSQDRSSAINYSNLCLCPAKHIDQYYSEVDEKIRIMFKALGFTDGLVFLQGHTDGQKITFYEMGCRLGGSFFNLEQAILGLNPVEMIVRYAFTGRMLESIDEIDSRSAEFNKVAMVCNYLLEGEGETVASIEGIDDVMGMEAYVALIQQRDIGFTIHKDKIVDKPILSFFMSADNMTMAKEVLSYMNERINVTNSNGKSILSKKFNPDKLEEYI